MKRAHCIVAIGMLLLNRSVSAEDNPWTSRAPQFITAARETPSVQTYAKALDAAFRADDWRTGLDLAREAQEHFPEAPELLGLRAQALWRAGDLDGAAQCVAALPTDTPDAVGLQMRVYVALARGDSKSASEAANQLAKLKRQNACDLTAILAVRMQHGPTRPDLPKLLRQIEAWTDADNGYPEIYYAEVLDGMAEFFEAIGPGPLNQVTSFGSADMPRAVLMTVPICRVMINGRGPYNLILDTGGSITLSIDTSIAEEIKLPLLAEAPIHGVGGKDISHQALVDELRIGEIVCRRVMTRVFDVRSTTLGLCDGIIGTGLFEDGRMTLDLANQKLVVERSSDQPAVGTETPLWVVSDSKILTSVKLNGKRSATGFWDSGADMLVYSPSILRELQPDEELRKPQALEGAAAGGIGGVGKGGAVDIYIGRPVKLEVAGATYDRSPGLALGAVDQLLCPMIGVQCDVLLGMPIFRDAGSVTIDFPKRRMWVNWLPKDEEEAQAEEAETLVDAGAVR